MILEGRFPVLPLSSNNLNYSPEIEQQWLMLTEKIRREILNNSTVRDILNDFGNIPVSESLPGDVLTKLQAANHRIELLLQHFEALRRYIYLPSVPDACIAPDLRNAPRLEFCKSMEGIARKLPTLLTEDEIVFLSRGITSQERQLVATRYRYARDIKLLALLASIKKGDMDCKFGNTLTRGEIKLPNGISLFIDSNNISPEELSSLLDPNNWKNRRQIKDRVYECKIGSTSYILKEKKTDRHLDTIDSGGHESNGSKTEFEVSKDLKNYGEISSNEVAVEWEEALGYLQYPDGFQFVFFRKAEGVCPMDKVHAELETFISKNRAQYEREYQTIKRIFGASSKGFLPALLIGIRIRSPQDSLTFEEYAIAKATYLISLARALLLKSIKGSNYVSSDHLDHVFKIQNDAGTARLIIFGYDLENFHRPSGKFDLMRDQEDGGKTRKRFWSEGLKPPTPRITRVLQHFPPITI